MSRNAFQSSTMHQHWENSLLFTDYQHIGALILYSVCIFWNSLATAIEFSIYPHLSSALLIFLSSMLSRNIPTVTLMMTKTNSWPTAPLTWMRSNNSQSAVNLLQMTVNCVTFNAAQQASYPSDNRTFTIKFIISCSLENTKLFPSKALRWVRDTAHTLIMFGQTSALMIKSRNSHSRSRFSWNSVPSRLHGWNNLSCFKLVFPCFLCAMWSACWRIKEEVMWEFTWSPLKQDYFLWTSKTCY